MSKDQSLSFDDLLEVARSRDEILGLYVFGSRGRNCMVDERSDWDVCVVFACREARDAFDREFPYSHGAQVEIVSATLDELRNASSEHSRRSSAHADVSLDKTGGELTRVVAEQESLAAGSRDSIVREALDDYVNQTYRSVRYGTRLDAVEAIPPALRTIFALKNRVRPEAQRELFNRIEPLARRAGYGDVFDGWEPDVDRLRGKGEYRA